MGRLLRGLIERAKDAILGNPYWIVLEQERGRFVLAAYRGEKRIPYSHIAQKQRILKYLYENLPPDGDVLQVPLHSLQDTKEILAELSQTSDYQTEIAPEVERLRLAAPPQEFRALLVWSTEKACLEWHLPTGTTYYGKGWFLCGDTYWSLPGMTVDDERWLQSEAIRGNDVLRCLARKVPEWKRKGLPFATEVRYYPTPFFAAVVRQVAAEGAILDVTWKGNPGSAKAIADLPGYVFVNGSVMPGATLRQLPPGFPGNSGLCRLSGESIPILLSEHWETANRFFTGRVDELVSTHAIIKGKCELTLALRRETRAGVGHPLGLPVCLCDGKRYSAEQVSRAIRPESRFVRVAQGWLPVENLRAADIGPRGTTLSGISLAPITLTPGEMLAGATARLGESWGKFESSVAAPPNGKSASDTAMAHLDFLRTWGIPGGIVGLSEQFTDTFRDFLSAVRTGAPDSRILVVAPRQGVGALASYLGGLVQVRLDDPKRGGTLDVNSPGLVLATQSTLAGAFSVHWNILCLIEADELVKSRTSQFLTALVACQRDVTIGLFASPEFLEKKARREAMTDAFRIDPAEADLVWHYGLRDPSQCGLALPSPSVPMKRRSEARAIPLEVAVDRGRPDRPVPIPPRTAHQEFRPRPVTVAEAAVVEVTYTTGAEDFVQKARKLTSYSVSSAGFVPFMCYWPTYDSMAEAQKKWYFYWRSRVRQGDYPDTDLSYVFVHVYELINNVGVANAIDGYEQLHKLWLAYRARFAKLDKYLVDWMTDYVIVSGLPGDPLRVYAEAMERKAYPADTDILLSYYISRPLSSMPLEVMERISDYRVRKSKFYCDGNARLVDKYLPPALDAVDEHMRGKSGVGIFDLYRPKGVTRAKRPAFQSAVYGGQARTVSLPPVVPYFTHAPLREFMTALVKHSENKLRELTGFKAKLRGYSLEADIMRTIDAFFTGRSREIAPPKVREVVIDLEKVKHLEQESDELRSLLVGPREDVFIERPMPPVKPEPADVMPVRPKIERPEGTPDGLLTDLNPVNEVLSQLGNEEMRLVHFLQEKGWEARDEAISAALQGCFVEALIDRINNLSMDALGDVLIVSEAEVKVVAEDYRDELDYLLKLGHGAAAPAGSPTSAGLPAGWSQFLSQLDSRQLKALAAVATESDPSSHIRRIAMEGATMPELLIDSINEIAMNTIGDCVIAPGSMPPIVEEEDSEMIGRILQLSNARN